MKIITKAYTSMMDVAKIIVSPINSNKFTDFYLKK